MTDALSQVCTDCGYIYDPAENGGIPLVEREGWECPGTDGHCGAEVDKFELVEPASDLDDDEDESTDGSDEPATTGTPRVKELSTERVDKAVIDLVRMYEDKELILRPDWQRYYVWSNKQASQLIESLFLRLPIPLIYLAEESDHTFSVVDGQQRLTALVEFVRNVRVDPMDERPVRLSGLDVRTDLNGKLFSELTKTDQNFLRNRELSIVRLRSESDPDLKLKVFRRLNTGSVKLNAQELRNAAFRGPYNDLLKQLARNERFLKELKGDAKPDLRMLDVELVLRFSAWLNRGWTTLTNKNIGEFLDQEMELGKSYKPGKLKTIEQQFKNAVELSHQAFDSRVFRRYFPGESEDHREGEWEMRQPNKALYDVVMFGFTRRSKAQFWPHLEAIRESLIDLMATDTRFQDAITSGTTDPRRVNYRFTTWLARLDDLVAEQPETRTFSRALKEKLFAANPSCELCGQKIHDIDDAHVHHVEHYWRGGRTIPENAALAHRYCNLSEGGGDQTTVPASAVEE
jgi:5-methylcytosine-specific restriction endonuclease McrA